MNHQSQGLAEDYFAADSANPTYSRQNRRFTGQHRQLLNSIALESTWSGVALRACLRRLATSDLTESWGVGVLDAWTDGPAAFCVVYRWQDAEQTLGIRMTKSGSPKEEEPEDAERFGRGVADFDIGEPLGTVKASLQPDVNGVHWWGYLDSALPIRPAR